jgi:acetyltransferase-like isoleucine patch superfamily enzyme
VAYVIWKSKEFFWTAFYRTLGHLFFRSLGKGCRFEGWLELTGRGGVIRIGNRVRIRRNVEFTVVRGAILDIGDDVFVGAGVVISAHGVVRLGSSSLIAEYVCIHDNNHVFANPNELVRLQGFKAGTCQIGEGSWVGAGCKILMNSSLGAHSVLGAGSILTGTVPDRVVACGNPARVLREIANEPAAAAPTSYTCNPHGNSERESVRPNAVEGTH